jgi:pimeloyl-ACP methyl ester carboxylesterase
LAATIPVRAGAEKNIKSVVGSEKNISALLVKEGQGKLNNNMEKIFIRNRKDQKIAVLIEKNESQKGLAFIMHGLGGFKESGQIAAIAETFKKNGYIAVRFDTANTYGESEGDPEDATVTNYYEDLEDVIRWASSQDWYIEPFVLAGHSLGGICTSFFAENYPPKIKALAPISTVVSGKLSVATKHHKEIDEEWKRKGFREWESSTRPGVTKRLKWLHIEDRLKYDLLEKVNNLIMPTLLIVGEFDATTPLEHQQILFKALPGPKELHIIKGAKHTFMDQEHLEELKRIFEEWIKRLD